MAHGETQKVIDACPDAEWRLIVALARYGGLRTPSEHFSLRWREVDWENGRIRVTSPKTAHHAGGGSRMIPLFPELRPYLEEVFDQAPDGAEYVPGERYRKDPTNLNLRSRMLDIIRAAGLKEWPKLFQNMRSTRETELAETFPIRWTRRLAILYISTGGRGGTRTRTRGTPHGILNPVRLPFRHSAAATSLWGRPLEFAL